MGTYEKGILGAFSGLVGPVVGATFRGRNVMRGRPRKTKRKATPDQLAQRLRFAAVTQFLTPAKVVLSEYFGMPSGARSRYNLATSYHLQEAVDFDGTVATILYNKALFSRGTLLPPQNLQATMLAGGLLELDWTDNSEQGATKASDTLLVLLYDPLTRIYEFYVDAGSRGDASATITLPDYLAGAVVQGWAFMASADGLLKSTSQYLGEMTVL